VVQIDAETLTGAELEDRVVGTNTEAIIALEAIVAREAATRIKERIGRGQTVRRRSASSVVPWVELSKDASSCFGGARAHSVCRQKSIPVGMTSES
jgi:hypothetical protein